MAVKLAGDVRVGDRILWDGKPADVTHAQMYRTAMLPGYQMEIMVASAEAIASAVWDAGDWVLMYKESEELAQYM